MNSLFIKHFFVGCMVSEIPRVSVLGYIPLTPGTRCISLASEHLTFTTYSVYCQDVL